MQPCNSPTVFISYKWEGDAHWRWVEQLARDLESYRVQVRLDRWELKPADSLVDYMFSGTLDADVVLFVMTTESVAAVEAAIGRGGSVQLEMLIAGWRQRQGAGGGENRGERRGDPHHRAHEHPVSGLDRAGLVQRDIRLIGILREGARPAAQFRDNLYIDFRTDSEYAARLWELTTSVLKCDSACGVVPRELAFDKTVRLPNQVFASELLVKSISLSRTRHDRILVTLRRDGARHAVTTTGAKRKLCHYVFRSRQDRSDARDLDLRIHNFFRRAADAPPELEVPMDRWPLRWGSGGVLSVVHWRGTDWIPFFFRDIKPEGWNLSLGASERDDDLSNPWSFQLREFYEETLILERAPLKNEVFVNARRFYLANARDEEQMSRAEHFSAMHRSLRDDKDNLNIRMSAEPIAEDSRHIRASFGNTRTELLILHGGKPHLHQDILVCINLLELGIEVVKILEYELDDNDYILDGETYALDHGDELVRMPVAMVRHSALRECFGLDSPDLVYDSPVQPSVRARLPASAIHVFPFDVERRRAIAGGAKGTPWEKERYGRWWKRHRSRFIDDDDTRKADDTERYVETVFTPAAAKILTYYFADPRSPRD